MLTQKRGKKLRMTRGSFFIPLEQLVSHRLVFTLFMDFLVLQLLGLPKPVVYTNLMMTSLDATLIMPEATQELQTHHYMNERWYSPLPSLHVRSADVLPVLLKLYTDYLCSLLV